MKVLVLNWGSSSLKFSVFVSWKDEEILWGSINRIWLEDSEIIVEKKWEKYKKIIEIKTHKEALQNVVSILKDYEIMSDHSWIDAIGHRVVHGGPYFSDAVIIDENVKNKISECSQIAPLHNPVNLACIEWSEDVFAWIPQIAVFDTAFHQTMPEVNYLYAIPRKFYEKYKIRKYGFHWISHQFVSQRLEELSGKRYENVITCHIWNWASISAIKDGRCINTSMWFTPVDGLVMWTRAGDIDPWVVLYLQEKEKLSASELRSLINRESWMLWLTWESADLRDIVEAVEKGNKQFELALDIYISRVVRFIWSYIADLGWVDAIVFTAGVLENSPPIRKKIAQRLAFCWVAFDEDYNDFRWEERELTTPFSPVSLFVIPTNEELMIKKEVEKLVKS